MKKSTYNKLVKMYDGLKAVNENSAKLPEVTRAAIDLSCVIATREALTEWDNEKGTYPTHENFLEFLTAKLAEAQYNMAEIIAKREGIEN